MTWRHKCVCSSISTGIAIIQFLFNGKSCGESLLQQLEKMKLSVDKCEKTQLFVFQWCMSCAMLLLFVCPVHWCVFLTSNTYNSRGLRHALGTSTTIFFKMCLSLRCWTGKAIIVPDAHFQCWHHIPFRSCYFAVRTWHKINPSDFFLLSPFHLLSLYPLMFFFFFKKKLINKAVTDDDADDWCGILCTMHQNEWRSVSEEKGKKRVKAQFLVNYFFRFLKKLNRCTKTFEFDVFKKKSSWSSHVGLIMSLLSKRGKYQKQELTPTCFTMTTVVDWHSKYISENSARTDSWQQ